MERKKITFDSFIRGSIGCMLVVGILMLVERLSGVLLPFFIAWLIAYMVYPLVKFFQYKLRLKSRIISIFCSLFLITVIGVTLFYLLVPPMISEIGRMNDLLVTYLTNGAGNNVPKNLSEFIHAQWAVPSLFFYSEGGVHHRVDGLLIRQLDVLLHQTAGPIYILLQNGIQNVDMLPVTDLIAIGAPRRDPDQVQEVYQTPHEVGSILVVKHVHQLQMKPVIQIDQRCRCLAGVGGRIIGMTLQQRPHIHSPLWIHHAAALAQNGRLHDPTNLEDVVDILAY